MQSESNGHRARKPPDQESAPPKLGAHPARPHCPLCGTPGVVGGAEKFQRIVCKNCGLGYKVDVGSLAPAAGRTAAASPTAESPADEVGRWLEGSPVQARRTHDLQYLRRWCTRHPLKAGFAASLSLLLLVVSVLSTWSATTMRQSLDRQRANEARQLRSERAARDELTSRLQVAEQERLQAQEHGALAAQDAEREFVRHLADRARQIGPRNPKSSLLLAAEAMSMSLGVEHDGGGIAHQSLRDALGEAGRLLLDGHTEKVTSLAISSDSRWLISGSFDHTARLWDLRAPDPAASCRVLTGHQGRVSTAVFVPHSQWVVTGSADGTARLWNVEHEGPSFPFAVLSGHQGRIGHLAVSSEGRWLVSTSSGFVLAENTARLWDLAADDPAQASVDLPGHVDLIHAVQISANRHWAASAGEDGTARLWDLTAKFPSSTSLVLRGHEGPIHAIAFTPDSRWLVTASGGGGSRDYTARLWDLTAPDRSAATILRGHSAGIRAVAVSQNNRWLVTASDDATARVWDLAEADPSAHFHVLGGHENPLTAVAIASDSRSVYTADAGGAVHIWRLDEQGPQAEAVVLRTRTNGVGSMTLTPDGKWLAVSGDTGVIQLWNLQPRELIDLARGLAQSPGDELALEPLPRLNPARDAAPIER